MIGFKRLLSNTELRNNLINSCFNERFLSIWLNERRTIHPNKVEIKLDCLTLCTGENCKGFTKNTHSLYEAIIPENIKTNSVGHSLRTENIYEARDSTMKRLSHIAETIAELKNGLSSQQEEHIIPIRQKILNLRTILDLMEMFVHGSHNKSKSIIGKNIGMKANIENTIKKIVVNMPILPNLLSQRLKVFTSKLKDRTKNKRNIKKRSMNYVDEWNGQNLYVNKLILKNSVRNFNEELFVERSSIHQMNGNISTNRLMIRNLKEKSSKILNTMQKRENRENTLPPTNLLKIVAKSINNLNWESFLKFVYRKGVNEALKGKYMILI